MPSGIMLRIFMPSVITLSVIILSVSMISVIMLSVFMLSVVMLNVVLMNVSAPPTMFMNLTTVASRIPFSATEPSTSSPTWSQHLKTFSYLSG
jgi:hypothetical protein